jgi:hypothetical protein
MKDIGDSATSALVKRLSSSTGVASDEVARVLGEIGLDPGRLETLKILAASNDSALEIEDVRVSVRIGGMIVAV